MSAITRGTTNMMLAMAVPAAGLVYLLSSNRSTVAGLVVFGVLWLTAAVGVNTIRDIARPVEEVAENRKPRRVLTPAYPAYVVNVSRPVKPWHWTSILLAPIELLGLAWSVPILVLLVMLPIGLVLAGALWAARLILNH
jgi:hypothetical protein